MTSASSRSPSISLSSSNRNPDGAPRKGMVRSSAMRSTSSSTTMLGASWRASVETAVRAPSAAPVSSRTVRPISREHR